MSPSAAGFPWEVFRVFLRLGCTSFGGPVAHLGYFREELVVRRRWVDEASYADLVGLCQFLPGPASSQVAFALGLSRSGARGAAAAWAGFTLPSVVVMLLFARGARFFGGTTGLAIQHGLQLAAVAIIAQAVLGMARTLCPDRERASIAGVSALVVLVGPSSAYQLGAILLGGVAGLLLCRGGQEPPPASSTLDLMLTPRVGAACLVLFCCLLAAGPLVSWAWKAPASVLFDAFYQAGALVFGGGHVVLPLLQSAVVAPGWVSEPAFLAGYGAAQAVPGPLFSFAAYLGSVSSLVPGVVGGLLALVAIYLPGILILLGALPFWAAFRRQAWARGAMRGIQAAVVGLLGAVLYDPVWVTSVHGRSDFAVTLMCFLLLVAWRAPPILVVGLAALGGCFL